MKGQQGFSEAEASTSTVPSILSSSKAVSRALWGGVRRGWRPPTVANGTNGGAKGKAGDVGSEAVAMSYKDRICYICTARFGITLRRHHCKICCNAVCTPCSPHLVDIDGASGKGPARTCTRCYAGLDAAGLLFNETPMKQRNKFQLTIAGVDGWPGLQDTETNTALVVLQVIPGSSSGWTTKTRIIALEAKTYSGRKRVNCMFECDIYSPVDSIFAIQIVSGINSPNPEVLQECRLPFICSALVRRECVQQQLILRPCDHHNVGTGSSGIVTVTTQLELIDMIMFPPSITDPLKIPFSEPQYGENQVNLTRDVVKIADLFPSSSPLHSKLFLDVAADNNQVLVPGGEVLLEVIDFCALPGPKDSASIGVLMLTTHRLIFIEYPNYGWISDLCNDWAGAQNAEEADADRDAVGSIEHENTMVGLVTRRAKLQQKALLETFERYRIKSQSSQGEASLVLFIPIGDIYGASMHRYIKKSYLGLLIITKDRLKYQFQCRNQTADPVETLLRLRRMKSEILWRSKDDAFGFNLDTRREYVKYASTPSSAVSSPTRSASYSTAFNVDQDDEWTLLLRAEYDRQLDHPKLRRLYRISIANNYYQICPTYPPYIMACANTSESNIVAASKERSIGRVGAVTWIHPETGAALLRSSQPIVGIKLSACPNDSKMLLNLRATAIAFNGDMEQIDKIDHDRESNYVEGGGSGSIVSGLDAVKGLTMDDDDAETAVWSKKARAESEADERQDQKSFMASWFDSIIKGTVPAIRRFFSYTRADAQDTSRNSQHSQDSDDESEVEDAIADDKADATDGDWMGHAEVLGSSQFHRDRQALLIGIFRGFDSIHGLKLRDKTYISFRDNKLKKMDSVRMFSGERRPSAPMAQAAESNSGAKIRVIDARPLLNAKGNVLMGKGHEIVDHIGGESKASVEFAGIENIHVVRQSYEMLRMACFAAAIEGERSATFLIDIHNSKWMHHLSSIIFAALCAATDLSNGDPVLVHCSDGWDRTSQVCCLAQLLLEPYYRTIEGFRILVMKDFNWFGHRFYLRSGLTNRNEYSPIFLQFLDCVWQVWRQFPWEFEFSESVLELLVFAYTSRCTSDFVFDNFRDHKEMLQLFAHKLGKEDVHTSVWDHILRNKESYTNSIYSCAPKPDVDSQAMPMTAFIPKSDEANNRKSKRDSFSVRFAEVAHPERSSATRKIRLLEPSSSLNALGLWEAVHLVRGIPFAVTSSGSSAAVSKGLAGELIAKEARIRELEEEIEKLRALVPKSEDAMKAI